jgi:sugar lactone lactonase YvrE
VVLDRVDDPRELALDEPALFVTAKGWHRSLSKHGLVLRQDLSTGAAAIVTDDLVDPRGIAILSGAAEETLYVAAERLRGNETRSRGRLFKVTRSGSVTPVPGPRLSRPPIGLSRDGVGALWLTTRTHHAASDRTPEDDALEDDADDDGNDWARGAVLKLSPGESWHRFATRLDQPVGLAFDAHGNLLVVEAERGRIIRFRAPPPPQVASPRPTNASRGVLSGSTDSLALIIAHAPAGDAVTQADLQGRFEISPSLLPDRPNMIEVFAVAAAGAGIASAPTFVTMIQDSIAPRLSLETPPDAALTSASPIPVRGTVTDATPPLQVFVNDLRADLDATGGFSTLVAVGEGPNEIRVQAVDAAGNTSILTRVVALDTTPPSLTLLSPAEGGSCRERA